MAEIPHNKKKLYIFSSEINSPCYIKQKLVDFLDRTLANTRPTSFTCTFICWVHYIYRISLSSKNLQNKQVSTTVKFKKPIPIPEDK